MKTGEREALVRRMMREAAGLSQQDMETVADDIRRSISGALKKYTGKELTPEVKTSVMRSLKRATNKVLVKHKEKIGHVVDFEFQFDSEGSLRIILNEGSPNIEITPAEKK